MELEEMRGLSDADIASFSAGISAPRRTRASSWMGSGALVITANRGLVPAETRVTIEHLEAPWTVIERIAEKSKWILLSTPLDEDPAIGNYEHYWSFTEQDVTQMLAAAGFGQLRCTHLQNDGWTYTYQVWTGVVV